MYDQFYGFTGRPFQLTPDPHFYFESGTHRKAMSYLGYGLAQGEGFIVITGDIGAGKTTLVGHLMNTIDPNRLTAVKLVSTQVDGDDLLRLVAEQFQLDWEGVGKAELLRTMEQYLREQARAGRRTLLIVDEGQNLSISALEELRMLSNFQLGGHSLLQIFLLGQPEFRQTLFQSPTLEQLRQRVIATHHLEPMEPEEVEPYIEHRLSKVGWDGNPSFSQDAYEEIFDHSEGVPRKLNVLVSRLLLFGAVEQLSRITAQHVRSVVAEVTADRGMDAFEPVAAPVAPPPFTEEPAEAAEAPFAQPAVKISADELPAEAPPVAEAVEAPLQWPQPVAVQEPAAVQAPTAPEVPAKPQPAPFATPSFGRNDGASLSRLNPRAEVEDVEILPPSRASSSFVEARSLVAQQLQRGSDIGNEADLPERAPFSADAVSTPDAPIEASVEMVAEAEDPPLSAPTADLVGTDAVEPVAEAAETAQEPLSSDGDAHMVALQRQIAGLEARIVDQDAALRRVLDLLIDWVERDPVNAPSPKNWAA